MKPHGSASDSPLPPIDLGPLIREETRVENSIHKLLRGFPIISVPGKIKLKSHRTAFHHTLTDRPRSRGRGEQYRKQYPYTFASIPHHLEPGQN